MKAFPWALSLGRENAMNNFGEQNARPTQQD
jgi:hypothetical protein